MREAGDSEEGDFDAVSFLVLFGCFLLLKQ